MSHAPGSSADDSRHAKVNGTRALNEHDAPGVSNPETALVCRLPPSDGPFHKERAAFLGSRHPGA